MNLGLQKLLLIYAFTPWTCDALASADRQTSPCPQLPTGRSRNGLSICPTLKQRKCKGTEPLPSTLLGSAKILPKQDPESLTLNRCSEVLHGSNTASDYPAEHTDTNCNSMWQLGVIKTAKWRKHIQRFVFRLWAGLCSI